MQYDPQQQLELLREKCKQYSPDIYHDYALYLQLIRNSLEKIVNKVVFILITDRGENLLDQLPIETKESIHKNIETLINRCSSLLTVEQLMNLAKEIEQEREIKRENLKKHLLSSLTLETSEESLPEGSVELGLDLPIQIDARFDEWVDYSGGNEVVEPPDSETFLKDQTNYNQDEIKDTLISELPNKNHEKNSDGSNKSKSGLDVLKSLFRIAGNAMNGTNSKSIDQNNNLIKNNNSGVKLNSSRTEDNISDAFFPDTPISLLSWTDSFEIALSRRLCNLSYALNVELIRMGIINTLLPMNLLEAVTFGHVEAEFSVSNLLTLKMPLQTPLSREDLDIACILLRASDFEFDDPRLQRCRYQLKRHRRLLLKMVRQQRHWKNRSIAKQAEQQWWQNPPRSSGTLTKSP